MAFLTPLRYPGGKGRLSNFIELVLQENNMLDAPYVEIYAGGAGIAFSLLFDDFSTHIHINDVSRSIYAFWYSVLNETDNLCSRIWATEVSIGEWNRQKYIQNHPEEVPLLDLGFSTFFLNRTNRSGIIKGGVIGGKNQNGPYLLDARFNKKELISRIHRIARYKNRITIYNIDAAEFIRHTLPLLPTKSMVYLDPPYYVKGKGLYDDFYDHEDHALLSTLVRSVQQPWIISYDNVLTVKLMYQDYRYINYKLGYSANERYKGTEIMFFSNELTIPPITNPVTIDKNLINNNFFLRIR